MQIAKHYNMKLSILVIKHTKNDYCIRCRMRFYIVTFVPTRVRDIRYVIKKLL